MLNVRHFIVTVSFRVCCYTFLFRSKWVSLLAATRGNNEASFIVLYCAVTNCKL